MLTLKALNKLSISEAVLLLSLKSSYRFIEALHNRNHLMGERFWDKRLKKNLKVLDSFGSVITGSSNFSEAGLINNLEFNVELKDYPDVKFALDKFEELWKNSTDIRMSFRHNYPNSYRLLVWP